MNKLIEPRLCCILTKTPAAMYALENHDGRRDDWCNCGFGLCTACANAISKGSIPSKLWPKNNTPDYVGGWLAYVDRHYYNDPECKWVKAFIKQEGEPTFDE